jgi:DNA-binding Lrp family transcriptional regulator
MEFEILELVEPLIGFAKENSLPAFFVALLFLIYVVVLRRREEKKNEELVRELRNSNERLEREYSLVKNERNDLQAKVRSSPKSSSEIRELTEISCSTDRAAKINYLVRFAQREEEELKYFPVGTLEILARKDKSLGVRRYAAKALARMKSHKSYKVVLDLAESDPHPAMNIYALFLCGKYLPESSNLKDLVKPGLVKLLQDSKLSLRQEAAWALNKMDDSFVYSQTYKSSEVDNHCMAFVLIRGLPESNQTVLRDFTRINKFCKYGVLEFGIIYGKFSVIAKILADNVSDLNQIILRDMQDLKWVESTRSLVVINERCSSCWSKDPKISSKKSISYVLFSTPASDTHGLIACLWDYSFSKSRVAESAGVYGESDVLARIEADSDQERDKLICRIIRELSPLIKSCEVFTLQTGTFDPDDDLESSTLLCSLPVSGIPSDYVSMSESTVSDYTPR